MINAKPQYMQKVDVLDRSLKPNSEFEAWMEFSLIASKNRTKQRPTEGILGWGADRVFQIIIVVGQFGP